jgi:hypothetical protein
MKAIIHGIVFAAVAATLVATAFADTLFLKNGERVTGYFEGGTARVVKFRGADGLVKDYDILNVDRLQFGDAPQAAAPQAAPRPAVTVTEVPRLLPADRPVAAASPAARTAGYTLPTGTKVTVRLVDSIDSEKQQPGTVFVAVLDEAIMLDGAEVAARGADVRGRISTVTAAGRGNTAAQLGLELTNLYINGISYGLTTSEYNEVADEKDVKTGRRAVGGAGIGAVIGALAGGGKGALIGAGVGGGAGIASAAMVKGEKLYIPAETRLQFTLRTPLVVAAK